MTVVKIQIVLTQENVELYQVIHGMLVNNSLRPYCNEKCSLINELRLEKRIQFEVMFVDTSKQ